MWWPVGKHSGEDNDTDNDTAQASPGPCCLCDRGTRRMGKTPRIPGEPAPDPPNDPLENLVNRNPGEPACDLPSIRARLRPGVVRP